MITREMKKLKKEKISFGKVVFALFFVCMALFAFYVGIKNLKDVTVLRNEILLNLTDYGVKLLSVYDHLLHISCGFIAVGIIYLYVALAKLRSYECQCGSKIKSNYKYCPECGGEIFADNEF